MLYPEDNYYYEHRSELYSNVRLKEETQLLVSAKDSVEPLSKYYSGGRPLKEEETFLLSAADYYEHLSEYYSAGGSAAASTHGDTLCGGHAPLDDEDPTTLLEMGHRFVLDDPDGSCDNDDAHELLEEADAYSAFRAAAAAAAGVEKATALAIVLLVIEHGAAPFDDPEVVALCRALDRESRESLVRSLEDYFGDFYDTASLELGSLRYALLHDDDEDVLFEPALLDEDVELWIDVLFFLVVFGAACALSAALRTFYRLASAHPHTSDKLTHPAVKATSRRRTKQRKKVVLTSLGASKSDPPTSPPTASSTPNGDDNRKQEHESDDDDEEDIVPAPTAAAARSVPQQAQPQRWKKAHRPHHHKEYRSLSKDGALSDDTTPSTTAIAVVSEASAAAAGHHPSPQPQRALTPPRRKKPAPPASTPQARRPIDFASSKVDRRSFAEAALGTAKPTEPPPSIVAASVKVVPLPPDVCDEDLRARFARYGGVVGARVFGDADPPHGFVDFECRADAVAAAFDAHGRSLFVDSDFGRVACIVRERALSDSDLGLPPVARLRAHV